MKLSVVIPIYNVEEYLEECLDSIYKLNIVKEVILINDESTDESYKIIEKYKSLYPKETIVINQKNKGLSGARNTGLLNAKGEYIAFIDSDDFIDSKKYEEFFNQCKNKELDIIIVSYTKYSNGEYLEVVNKDIEKIGVVSGKVFFEKSIKNNCFREQVWDDIYRREFLIINNLKFKERLLHEDTLFFIQALSKATRVEFLNIPIYNYRQREGSIMSKFSYRNHQHRILIISELLEFQRKEKIKLKGLNEYLLNLLWSAFKNERVVNIKQLNKLVIKDIYGIKSYIKVIIMYLARINCKTIEPIDLESTK